MDHDGNIELFRQLVHRRELRVRRIERLVSGIQFQPLDGTLGEILAKFPEHVLAVILKTDAGHNENI